MTSVLVTRAGHELQLDNVTPYWLKGRPVGNAISLHSVTILTGAHHLRSCSCFS